MLRILSSRSWIGLAISLLLISSFVFSSSPNASASSFSFKTFELSSIVGTVCPNSSKTCTNGAAEPAIRGDKAGNFFTSSENGLGAGTDAWRSKPATNGLHYTTVPSPDAGSSTNDTGFAPGGGDTDLAIAPAKNSVGNYNVYVASLSLANVDVSTSTDEGKTWSLNPTGATVPGDDREWIAADGASKVCISYHDVATDNIDVDCSFDAGKTFTQLGDAIDSNHLYLLDVVGGNEIGNLMIDPGNHYIYQTFSGIDSGDETTCAASQSPCNTHVVYMAVSTDGGKTFTDNVVYDNPNRNVSYGHQFVNVSIDKAGNVFSVYSDNHNLYYSYSTNHGTTWSAPVQVNSGSATTAIFPWSVANRAGHIDIVYYGTSYYDGTNPPDNYPASAAWYVYMAQNLKATTSGSSFTQVQATPIIHFGGVCEGGISCTGNSSQNRDLFDDFGIAVDLQTSSSAYGFASIVYSDDQYINDANDPAASGCTASTTNTSSCDHTSIATQTGGTAI